MNFSHPGLPGYAAIAIAVVGVAADWGRTTSKVGDVATVASHADTLAVEDDKRIAVEVQKLDDAIDRLIVLQESVARIETQVSKPVLVEVPEIHK